MTPTLDYKADTRLIHSCRLIRLNSRCCQHHFFTIPVSRKPWKSSISRDSHTGTIYRFPRMSRDLG